MPITMGPWNSNGTGKRMKKKKVKADEGDLRPEYDLKKLKGGVRGKHLSRFRAGTNLAAPPFRRTRLSIKLSSP